MKLKLMNALVLALWLVFLGGCAHKQSFVQGDPKATLSTGGLTIFVKWIKFKKKNVDVMVDFLNSSQQTMTFPAGSRRGFYNGTMGELGGSSVSLQLAPGERASVVQIFKFDRKLTRPGNLELRFLPQADGMKFTEYKFDFPIE